MSTLYKFSPIIVFVIAYFIWNDSQHNSPLVLAGNGLIILAVVMIMALIPALGIYFKGQQKHLIKSTDTALDDFQVRTKKASFYSLFSKLIFYIGLGLCLLIVLLKFSYQN